MPGTSPLGHSTPFEGTLIQALVGSPAAPVTVANVDSFDMPVMNNVVEDTNVSDHWVSRRPTLSDMGKITFGIFWMPTETTHRNTSGGLRYMLINQLLTDWEVVYPDGLMSTDQFPAYVTGFKISAKVKDVYKGALELSNSGAPTLV